MRTPSFYIKVLVLFVSIIAPVVFAQAVFFDETPQTTVEQAQDFLRNLTYDFSDELRGGVEHLVNTGRLVVRESGDAYVEPARFAVLLFSDIGGRVGAGGSAAIASTLYGVESVARVDALRDAANVVTNIGPILVRVPDAFVAAGVGVGDRMLVGIADVVHVFAKTNRLVGDAAYEFGEHVGAGFIALGEYPHHIYAAVSRVGSHHAIATTRESLRDRGVRGSHIARGVAIDAPAVVATVGGAVDDTGWRSVWNDVRETIVGLFGNSTFPPYVFNRQENVSPVVTEQQIDDAPDFAEQSQEEPTAPTTTIVERIEYISEPSVVYQTNNTLSSGVSAYELAAAIAGLRAELVPQIELAMRRPRTESHSSGGGGGGGDLDEDELTEYLDDYLPLVGGTLTGDLAGTNVALSGSLTAASLAVTGTTTLSGVAYDFPDADGINGQLLTTDGAGGLSWTTVASGVGTTTWGTIIGTLADQTDLQDALDAKLSTTTADATYTPNTRTLEVAGTADQITSSAGAQDLSGNRTWTLSLPSFVSFPGSYFADAGTTTNATSTNFAVTNSFNFLGTIITDVAAWFSGLFDSNFATKDTDDLTEGAGNFYYTTGRFATDLAGTTTDALDEGLSNLYYTDARVGAYITGSTTLASSINYWTEDSGNVYRASGNVGIGVNPTRTLDILSASETGVLYLDSTGIGSSRIVGTVNNSGANTATLDILGGNAATLNITSGGWVDGILQANQNQYLELGTTNGYPFRFLTNNTEVARFDTSGNFGIGSTTPSARLAVVGASGGTAEAPAALVVVGGTGGTDTSSPPNNAGFDGGLISFLTGAGGFAEGNTQGGDGGVFRITTGNGGDGDFTGTGGNGGDIILSLGSGGSGAVAGRDGYLILAPDVGLVGIGTTTPGQKLAVDGTVGITGATTVEGRLTLTSVPTGTSVSQGSLYINPNQISSIVPAPEWTASGGWNAPDIGIQSMPAFADLDNDGDYDLMIGAGDGIPYAYENTGNSSAPTWTAKSDWNGPDLGSYIGVALADLDNDGDYDLMIGADNGISYAYENTGNSSAPTWTAKSDWNAAGVGAHAAPAFVDLDGDGDSDLMIGSTAGISYAYENTGNSSAPTWTAKSDWNGPDVGTVSAPAFADLDGDGDNDLVIGENNGISYAYENTGNSSAPTWTAKSDWDAPDIGGLSSPAFADLDGDGDSDLMIGSTAGISYAYENTGIASETGHTLFGIAVNDSARLRVSGNAVIINNYLDLDNYLNVVYDGTQSAATIRQNGSGNILDLKDGATTVFTVLDGGNVGIGTTDPASILHIKSDPASDPGDVVFTIQNNDGDLGQTAGIEFVNSTVDSAIGASITAIRSDALTISDNDLAFSVRSSGTLTEFMRIVGDGNIGIGTSTPAFTLTVDGTVGFDGLTALVSSGDALCLTATNEVGVNTGAQTCTVSSIRFKHGEEDLESGLESVRALRARSFIYNGTEEERVGLIAEEVELVDSRLIFYEPDGTTPRGVRYEDVVALLVKAIQELDEKIELLLANAQTGISNFFEVIAERITTKQLCLEDVCITKTQLEQLLEANNIDPVVNEPADHSEDSEDLSGAEDGVITDETDSLSETNDEGLDGAVGDGGDEALDDAQDVDDGLEGGDANNGDDVEGALPGEDAQEGADTIESDLGEASANDSESSDDASASSDDNPSGDADTSSVDGDESTSDDSQSGTDGGGGELDGGNGDAASDASADDSSSE